MSDRRGKEWREKEVIQQMGYTCDGEGGGEGEGEVDDDDRNIIWSFSHEISMRNTTNTADYKVHLNRQTPPPLR